VAGSVASRSAISAAARTLAILGLVYLEGSAVEVLAVQGLHRTRRIGIRHFHETEATGPAGVAIVDQGDFLNRSMRSEKLADGIFSSSKG